MESTDLQITDCVIYRCSRKTGMYLYLRANMKTEELPADLRKITGALEHCFDLALTPGKKLAREKAKVVIANLLEKGYHLQMPPPQAPAMEQDERLPSSLDVG